MARDDSKLWSIIENSIITVQVQDFLLNKVITNFIGLVDRENKNITLSWNYISKEKVNSVSIYKNIVGQPPTLWRELSSKSNVLIDTSLKMNTQYEYHLNLTLKSNAPAKIESIMMEY